MQLRRHPIYDMTLLRKLLRSRKHARPSVSPEAIDWAESQFSNEERFDAAYVGDLLTEILGIPFSEISRDSRFTDELRADELEPVEIVMALEEDLGIRIPDSDCERLATVCDLVRYIRLRTAQRGD